MPYRDYPLAYFNDPSPPCGTTCRCSARNLLAQAPKKLYDEISADYADSLREHETFSGENAG